MVKYPNVKVQLTGEDGNIFNLIGIVRRHLRDNRVSAEVIKQFVDEVTASGSYDEALAVIMSWVDVS